MAEATITLSPPGAGWRYVLRTKCTCRLAGDEMRLTLTLSKQEAVEVPDVRQIDAWAREVLAEPTTAEEFCLLACERWRMDAKLVALADSHGEIEAEATWRG